MLENMLNMENDISSFEQAEEEPGNDFSQKPTKAQFHSETIRGIVVLFYKNLLVPSSRQYTIAYSLCKVLAKRFHEEKYLGELDKLYRETTIGYPLGLIQNIVYRDTMLGFSTNKSYNYGFHSRPVRLGDMVLALDLCMDRIFDIFTEICVDKDLDTTSLFPLLQDMQLDRGGI